MDPARVLIKVFTVFKKPDLKNCHTLLPGSHVLNDPNVAPFRYRPQLTGAIMLCHGTSSKDEGMMMFQLHHLGHLASLRSQLLIINLELNVMSSTQENGKDHYKDPAFPQIMLDLSGDIWCQILLVPNV